ncbi:unnamed protein product [Bursaphelenchus xylophilus]|uniref:(pine wood nematode) hypothetical protein n=1 Tax=Bursaphelenchus xylophilus TaxID=6326 RepID=A0A1I7SBK5_BURXY|nr:unnamed protein product [Bursaphelenchus xylophilus]CAG9114419.1 unnamed protein product [Bursaphelenchus xylophilus]
MDESMEPGPSRCDPNIDSAAMDVSSEKELMEKRKKGLEKAREKLNQRKQMKIKLAGSRRNIARQPSEVEVLKNQLVQLTQENTQLRLRNSEMEKQLEKAERALALSSPRKRRKIDELGVKQKAERIGRLEKHIGDAVEIRPKTPENDVELALFLKNAYRLTEFQYQGLQKFAVNWSPLHHVKQREKDLIEAAGGLDTTEASVGWTNPSMAFGLYVQRLVETAWSTRMPDAVDVVIVADGGGDGAANLVKMGLFIPTGVPAPQIPYNVLLLSAYTGKESRENLITFCEKGLDFLNRLCKDKRFEVDGRQIACRVLLCSNLNVVPVILGIKAATQFCPNCTVERAEHKRAMTTDAGKRTYRDSLISLLQEDVVCPPLHCLQGLTNTLAEEMKKNNPDEWNAVCDDLNIEPSHLSKSMLNGRDGRRLVKSLAENGNPQFAIFSDVFSSLDRIYGWATVGVHGQDDPTKASIERDIFLLSNAWRHSGLPAINKLHLLEAHVADFVTSHGSWGLYGEQGLESLHHVGNVASARGFGKNSDVKAKFFFKSQFFSMLSRRFDT